ncbi:glutathione S-transferase family protein [Sesbania bispinosa]|nr:glutathione S-transferase family protein [Sesbania bispinosa]
MIYKCYLIKDLRAHACSEVTLHGKRQPEAVNLRRKGHSLFCSQESLAVYSVLSLALTVTARSPSRLLQPLSGSHRHSSKRCTVAVLSFLILLHPHFPIVPFFVAVQTTVHSSSSRLCIPFLFA